MFNKEFRDSPVIASSNSNLDNGHVNPVANGEFTIFTPLSPPHYNNNVFLANEQIITRTSEDYVNGDFDVSSWFNESEKDFPRIKLKYIKELGKGWFGKVVEGAAKDLQNEQTWTPVVVRILEATASRKERVVFLNDAAIYRCGTHPNILFLIGRCLDTVPLLLLQEYCPQGDLKTYLRANKENADKLLSTDHPLLWCCQLSSALKHLHDNKVTHPDLATRNCQLTSNLTLKLGDYGLAVFKYPEDYYQGSPGVPVRWCSPESLNCTLTTIQPKKTTPESNIWSFSVTIWEILECGEQPYPDLSDDEVVSQVLGSNIRLSRPSFPFLYTDYMYRLMQLCWTSAESRPTVTQINLILTDLLQVHKNTKNNMLSVNDFDKRWELLKPNAIVKSDSISDAVNFESEEIEVKSSKPLSPSLNNLHGSLDDLLLHSSDIRMNSWSENASETDDFTYAKNECNEIQESDDPLTRENSSSDSSSRASPKLREPRIKSKINFDLSSKYYDNNSKYNFSDSVLFSQRTSSESETEDENWRNKVERGAYTEKVRLKSRSVADLMILTHVDYSESESETPLPSLDYRINYKNVRYAPKNNLENVSLTYGSEGNLLNVHDTFQHDLKKMQEERRDSLLFVPDNRSQSSVLKLDNNTDNLFMTNLVLSESNISNMHLVDTPSKRLMHELNSTADMKPANQVFNVFNVTIDKFKPIKVNNCKLNEIINFNDDISHSFSSEKPETTEKKPCERPEEIQSDFTETNLNNQNYAQNSNNCITNLKHISDSSKNTYPAAESIEIYRDTNTVILSEMPDDEKSGNSFESDVIKSETTSEILKEDNSEMCKKLDNCNQQLNDSKSLHIHKTDCDNISQHMEPYMPLSLVQPLSEIIQNKLIVSDDEKLNNSSESDVIKSENTSKISKGNPEMCKQVDNSEQHPSESEFLYTQKINHDNLSQDTELKTCLAQVPPLSEIIQNNKLIVSDEKNDNGSEGDVIKSEVTSETSKEDSKMCNELDNFNHLNENKSLHSYSIDLDNVSQHVKPKMCFSQVPSLSEIIQNKLIVPVDKQLGNSFESDVIKSEETEISKEGNSETCKGLDSHHMNESKSLHGADLDNISQYVEPKTCPPQIPSLSEIIQNKLSVSDDEKCGNRFESDVIKSETTNKVPKEGNLVTCKDLDDLNQQLNESKSLHIHGTNLDTINQYEEPKVCLSQVPSLSEIVQNKSVVSDDEELGNRFESDAVKGGTTSEISKESNSEKCNELDNCNQQLNGGKSLRIHRTDFGNTSEHMEPKMCLSQVPSLSEIIQNKLIYPITNLQNEDEDKVKLDSTSEYDSKIKDTEKHESHSSFDITNSKSPFESEKHVEEYKDCDISNCEISETDKLPDRLNISFDLSNNQEKIMPNSLTHYGGFSSTPFKKKIDRSLPSEDVYSSLNLFNAAKEDDEINEEKDFFSNLTTTVENTCDMNNKDLNYSLETWDNFLGKTLDNQNEIQNENLFDSFSSEPHSLLFVQNPDEEINQNKPEVNDNTFDVMNKTFIIEDECNKTFIVDASNENEFLNKSNTSHSDDGIDNCSWESGEGWFLHPQSNEELSGAIEVASANTDSYVGFGIDDEIMAAIRNELLTKLPQAQVATSEKVQEAEDWESSERDEVFLKYNVYNPPLSPILEESYIEDFSGVVTPKHESENDDSEWSQPCIPENLLPDTESHSAQTYESPLKEPHHRHTPSQDSCCSNDTLFNLEELTCATTDFEKEKDISLLKNTEESGEKITDEKVILDATNNTICSNEKEINKKTETNNNNDEKNLNVILEPIVPYQLSDQVDICEQQHDIIDYGQSNLENDINQLNNINIPEHTNFDNTHYINNFLTEERDHSSKNFILIDPYSKSNSSSEETPVAFTKCQVAPLPSPEDNPWKQLPASMLSYDKVKSQSKTSLLPPIESKHISEYNEHSGHDEHENKFNEAEERILDDKEPNYVNCDVKDIIPVYENVDKASDFYNEADYVNIENLENTRNNAEQVSPTENEKHNYVNCIDQSKNDIIKNEMDNDDDSCIFDMLTNIKFNGPIDNQLISTSFSESNDLNDEQDWDSGSDTRSSSSGEFIWKEGEHEESLKALRAAPQDMESINPSAGNAEESSDESDISSSTSGEEEETPEFIPSAWDKFATPTKSALRSPEKTLEKSDMKKTKGVWFKKQKYHCIYEYPREPESPVLQSDDLWKLQNSQIDYNSFTDWEFDADNYLPPQMDESDISPPIYQPKHISSKNLYQLTNITDLVTSNTGEEDGFFVNNSSGLIDIIGSLSSQFFPGSTNWVMENATPDSGVEDITPGSLTDSNEFSNVKIPDSNSVQTLKKLAAEAVNKNRQINIRNNDVLGGLRHTRNMLTLDLPLSPSAFTSAKTFMVEPPLESVVREKPTFTTFGKSRFLVQHVDTPSDEIKSKNVSFEALPYTPLKDSKKKNNSHVELRQNTNQNQEISEESHILKHNFNTENCKGKFELVKGEASLLDSADEDSGIESSTLERKLTYNVLS